MVPQTGGIDIKNLPLARLDDIQFIDNLGHGLGTQTVFSADFEHAHQLGILIGAGELSCIYFRSVSIPS